MVSCLRHDKMTFSLECTPLCRTYKGEPPTCRAKKPKKVTWQVSKIMHAFRFQSTLITQGLLKNKYVHCKKKRLSIEAKRSP